MVTVKNSERDEIWPYFQADMLAWHSFMDAGRSSLFTAIIVPRVSTLPSVSFLAQFPQGNANQTS